MQTTPLGLNGPLPASASSAPSGARQPEGPTDSSLLEGSTAGRQHCEENLPRGQDQHREGLAHLAVGERLKQLPLSQAAQDRVDTAVLSAMRQMLPASGGTLARIALDCDQTDNPQPPLSGPDRQALNRFVLAELSEKPGWHAPWMDFLQAVSPADQPGPEGLRTLLELRDDPHFKALLENQRSVCTRVQDQGPVLRIGSTFLRKRQWI